MSDPLEAFRALVFTLPDADRIEIEIGRDETVICLKRQYKPGKNTGLVWPTWWQGDSPAAAIATATADVRRLAAAAPDKPEGP